MKCLLNVLPFLIIGATMAQSLVCAGNPMANCVTNPPDFQSLSYDKAYEAMTYDEAWRLKEVCPEYITNLVNQIRSKKIPSDNMGPAIYLLGVLRTTNSMAIEALIDIIDFKATKLEPKSRIRGWGEYPVVDAFWYIRKPAVEPLCSRLCIETNDLRRELMCKSLMNIEGWETALGRVRKLSAVEKDDARRKNLEAAVKELEKMRH